MFIDRPDLRLANSYSANAFAIANKQLKRLSYKPHKDHLELFPYLGTKFRNTPSGGSIPWYLNSRGSLSPDMQALVDKWREVQGNSKTIYEKAAEAHLVNKPSSEFSNILR